MYVAYNSCEGWYLVCPSDSFERNSEGGMVSYGLASLQIITIDTYAVSRFAYGVNA